MAATENYSMDEVHGGSRSLRTGFVDAVMNTYSYSAAGYHYHTVQFVLFKVNVHKA